MLTLDPTARPPTVMEAFSTRLGILVGAFIKVTVGMLAVVCAFASGGAAVGYFFPVTFADFLTLIGLGKYALWQVTAVLGFLAATWGYLKTETK